MSVYVSDKEMDLLRELYDFNSTQMEGASLSDDEQKEHERKSALFWSFYDKCRKDKADRNFRNKVKSVLRASRKLMKD